MIIAVDFDGTIIEKCCYPETHYKLKPFCRSALNILARNNKIVLCTARYGWYYWYCLLWIRLHKLPIYISIHRKPVADVYIDDKNFNCKEINWLDIVKQFIYQENQI